MVEKGKYPNRTPPPEEILTQATAFVKFVEAVANYALNL